MLWKKLNRLNPPEPKTPDSAGKCIGIGTSSMTRPGKENGIRTPAF
jgi:hypothetical protein